MTNLFRYHPNYDTASRECLIEWIEHIEKHLKKSLTRIAELEKVVEENYDIIQQAKTQKENKGRSKGNKSNP
jgi:hypothetical protein